MKKGLILALTMVAMVALVMPALALAPLVEPLPSVIIGDSEAGQISGDNHLFTYNNVMNIATSSKIAWQNAVSLGFGDEQMHAYYLCDPVGGVQVSTPTRLVQEVVALDIANIASAGAAPAAAKTITDAAGDGGLSDFWWLSLATNMSGATSSYTADAAVNGQTIALTNVTPVDVTLFLADGDFPTTAVTQADSFTVYTVPTGADGFSGGGVTVYTENFTGGASNWSWYAYVGDPAILALPTGTAAGGQLVHTAAATAGIHFGTWVSGTVAGLKTAVVDVQDDLLTDIFRGTFSLTSTSTNGALTMGYRLLYTSVGFGHLGGITQYDGGGVATPGTAVVNAPTASSPKDIKVYWAAPFQLTEMSDTGKLATVAPLSGDLRDYILNFDAIQTSASDTGNLALDNVLVETIDKPTAASSMAAWGVGNNAFNGAVGSIGWVDLSTTYGLPKGTATLSAGGIVLTAGTNTTGGYQGVGMFGTATGLPTILSDQLVICTATVATQSFNTTPTYRIINLSVLASTGETEAMQWADVFDPNYSGVKTLYSTGNLPCCPNTTPTAIESYIYTNSVYATGTTKLDPLVDCYQLGVIGSWPLNSGNLSMTGFKYELAN